MDIFIKAKNKNKRGFFQVECFPEIAVAPRTVANYSNALKYSFRNDLDNYLRNRAPVSFLSELRSNLQINGPADAAQAGNRYNIQVCRTIEALALWKSIYTL